MRRIHDPTVGPTGRPTGRPDRSDESNMSNSSNRLNQQLHRQNVHPTVGPIIGPTMQMRSPNQPIKSTYNHGVSAPGQRNSPSLSLCYGVATTLVTSIADLLSAPLRSNGADYILLLFIYFFYFIICSLA